MIRRPGKYLLTRRSGKKGTEACLPLGLDRIDDDDHFFTSSLSLDFFD